MNPEYLRFSQTVNGWTFTLTLRRIQTGERRRNGDFWWDGFRLQQLKDLGFFSRKRIPAHGFSDHYRVCDF